MERKDLRRWARWAATIDGILERATSAVESGRRLFVVANLRRLRLAIPRSPPDLGFVALLEDLEEESAPTV
jgi:hypothetical protein